MIEIEVNGAEKINAALTQLAEKLEDRTELMRNIAGTMESAILQNFEAGGRQVEGKA